MGQAKRSAFRASGSATAIRTASTAPTRTRRRWPAPSAAAASPNSSPAPTAAASTATGRATTTTTAATAPTKVPPLLPSFRSFSFSFLTLFFRIQWASSFLLAQDFILKGNGEKKTEYPPKFSLSRIPTCFVIFSFRSS